MNPPGLAVRAPCACAHAQRTGCCVPPAHPLGLLLWPPCDTSAVPILVPSSPSGALVGWELKEAGEDPELQRVGRGRPRTRLKEAVGSWTLYEQAFKIPYSVVASGFVYKTKWKIRLLGIARWQLQSTEL